MSWPRRVGNVLPNLVAREMKPVQLTGVGPIAYRDGLCRRDRRVAAPALPRDAVTASHPHGVGGVLSQDDTSDHLGANRLCEHHKFLHATWRGPIDAASWERRGPTFRVDSLAFP